MSLLERLNAALAGRYRVERPLGEGGMATVYLAHDIRHDRRVAIKVLRGELAEVLGSERFLAEIKTTANLRHPHIVPLFDSGEAAGLLYYVMPLAEGETLRHRLDRERQLPIEDALRIAAEVADALDHAHARGVVHRDIKPENILLEGDHVSVADFGIARALWSVGTERLTQTGISVGTPAYMSPEQAAGEREIDGRADLYSLGCVLYEMLGGQPPFTGPTAAAVIRQHLVAAAPPLALLRPSVPAHITTAITRALAKTPSDRFEPVRQFAVALDARSTSGAAAEAGTPRAVAEPRATVVMPHRRPWSIAAAIAATVAVAALAWRLAPNARTEAEPRNSVAVLPFTDLSADRSQMYLGDGIAETMISALAQAPGVIVLPRSVSFAQRENSADLKSVGRALRVGTVLEGSVQRSGDRLRITSALIAVHNESVLWSKTFDRRADDIFAVQDEVVQAVLAQLLGDLEAARAPVTNAVGTTDLEAYSLYLQGNFIWYRRSLGDFDRAKEMFRRAIARDPAYAAPWSGLANTFLTQAFLDSLPARDLLRQSREAAERATRLDTASVGARTTLANLRLLLDRDFAGADSALQDVRRRAPRYVLGAKVNGNYLLSAGLPDSALAELHVAYALEPALAITMFDIGHVHRNLGRPDSAITWFKRALDLAPRLAVALNAMAEVAASRGDSATTLTMLARLKDASARVPMPIETLQRAWGRGGKRELARVMGDTLLNPHNRAATAAWLAIGGEYDAAFAAWGAALDRGDAYVLSLPTIRVFDPVRRDPRFRALLQRSGAPPAVVERFLTAP